MKMLQFQAQPNFILKSKGQYYCEPTILINVNHLLSLVIKIFPIVRLFVDKTTIVNHW